MQGQSDAQADAADASLDATLEEIERRGADVRDLTAQFEERKQTALLKEPLVSRGVVRIRGSDARWDTQEPHRMVTYLSASEVRIYYPERRTVEVYEIGAQMQFPAVSPRPQLAELREHFRIASLPFDQIKGEWHADRHIALRLTPLRESLAEYVERVDVVVDRQTALLVRAEIANPDGDHTVLTFSDVQVNTGLTARDVRPDLPAGTRVVRPLRGDSSGAVEPEEGRP